MKEKLTLLENQCLISQESKTIKPSTFILLEKYSKKLKPVDSLFTSKCIKVLKEDLQKGKNTKDVIFKVYDLKENVIRLLKESSEKKKSIPDMKNLKNISIESLGEKNRDLETLYVNFDIDIKPYGKNRASVKREIERLIVKNDQLGTKIIKRLLSKFTDFKGTGIYQGYLRATPVNPGESIKARNELAIDTNYSKDEKTFEEYVDSILGLLEQLDGIVLDWLEIDNYDEDNVDAPLEDEEETEEEKRDKEYYKGDKEFENLSDEEIEEKILKRLKVKKESMESDEEVIEEDVDSLEEKEDIKVSNATLQEFTVTLAAIKRFESIVSSELNALKDGTSPYLKSAETIDEIENWIIDVRKGLKKLFEDQK